MSMVNNQIRSQNNGLLSFHNQSFHHIKDHSCTIMVKIEYNRDQLVQNIYFSACQYFINCIKDSNNLFSLLEWHQTNLQNT